MRKHGFFRRHPGEGTPMILAIVLVLLMLFCTVAEFSRVWIIAQGVKEAAQQAVIREMTKPLFSIPPHQFLFNAGSIDKRSYMEMLQLDEAEYNLIKFPQRGVCLYKCGNERYLLEVHAPAYKEKLFGTAGGR